MCRRLTWVVIAISAETIQRSHWSTLTTPALSYYSSPYSVLPYIPLWLPSHYFQRNIDDKNVTTFAIVKLQTENPWLNHVQISLMLLQSQNCVLHHIHQQL